MKLHTLLEKLHPLVSFSGDNSEITSIANDNRKVIEGSLFVCIKGYTVDGHSFALDAVKKGAVAVLAESKLQLDVPVIVVKDTKRALSVLADAFFGQPSHKMHVIGITGTNGKTTTSHLIDQILIDAGKKTGLIGTMYTKIGDQINDTKNTTPESLTLQKTLKDMVDCEVENVTMEVSSHALDEGRVHGVDYDVAVFTNLTQDHLDYHKTMDDYRRAKGLLFAQLGNVYYHDRPKYAVLNMDDPASKEYIRSTSAVIVTYGIDEEADIMARNIEITANGTTFELISPFGKHFISMQLLGKFSVYNVLASISAGLVSGVSIDSIIATIAKIEGVSGRFELVNAGQNFTVIVDYSHTPDSLENALKTINEFAKKRVLVVVGCGGDRDKTKRPLMAQIACKYSTNPIFTSDNPRSEDPEQILLDMTEGVKGEKYEVMVDRREAIFHAVRQASEQDIILIAGKGHETYQQIGKEFHDFDDRLVAREAIEER